MDKSELVDAVAEATGLSLKDAGAAVTAAADTTTAALVAGDKVSLPGFATFEVTDRPAREGRNPATGEALKIPASKGVKITAGAPLKAAVKKAGRKK